MDSTEEQQKELREITFGKITYNETIQKEIGAHTTSTTRCKSHLEHFLDVNNIELTDEIW